MDSIERARELNINGQHLASHQMLLRLANIGDAKAMLELGVLYGTGDGVEKDEYKAVEWFHKAAILGNAAAQLNLGIAYERGMGAQLDLNEAIKWYEEAAKNGSTKADSNLANLYSGKYGGPFIPEQAIHHFCSVYKGKQGLSVFSFFPELQEKVTQSLKNNGIEGNKIYLRQSDAKVEADRCLECNGKKGLCSTYLKLVDIIFFPEVDNSVLSDINLCMQCTERRTSTSEALRCIPCFEVSNWSKVYGRFAFLIEDYNY